MNMIPKIITSYTITPHDSNALTGGPCDAVLVGVAGNLAVIFKDPVSGSDITDVIPLIAGVWHYMSVKTIKLTSTTATGIHAGYFR